MRQYWENEDYKFPPFAKHDKSVFVCHVVGQTGKYEVKIENADGPEEILKERPLVKSNDKIIKIEKLKNQGGGKETVWEEKSRIAAKVQIKTWNVRLLKNNEIVKCKIDLKSKQDVLNFYKKEIDDEKYDDLIDIFPEGGKIASYTNRLLKQKLKEKLKLHETAKSKLKDKTKLEEKLNDKTELEEYIKSKVSKKK